MVAKECVVVALFFASAVIGSILVIGRIWDSRRRPKPIKGEPPPGFSEAEWKEWKRRYKESHGYPEEEEEEKGDRKSTEKAFILVASLMLIITPLLFQQRLNAVFSGEENVIAIGYSGNTPRIMVGHYLLGICLGCLITWTYIRGKYQVYIFFLAVLIVILQTIFIFQLWGGAV